MSFETDWESTPPDSDRGPLLGRLRLRSLVNLRWLAVLGQSVAILIVFFGFGFDLPILFCAAFIMASAGLNVGLHLTRPLQRFATDREAFWQLAYDAVQLIGLVTLTGGWSNPFLILLVAPITVGFAALPPRWSAALVAIAMAGGGLMAYDAFPLPWNEGDRPSLPDLYLAGMATAMIITIAFTAAYAWRIGQEAQRMGAALTATQGILAREQRLSALGALSAAAAHELGTPLATIQLTAKELARGATDPVVKEDAELLVSQAERCRDILKRLSEQRNASDAMHDRVALNDALEEISAPLRGLGTAIVIKLRPPQDGAETPVLIRQQEILYGVGNLIENAVEFADARVNVTGWWDETRIGVIIEDDGPGFSPDILSKIGEPYISSRKRGEPGGGLGLGVFIAITLNERLGGHVHVSNESALGGARVTVTWPRSRVEVAGNAV